MKNHLSCWPWALALVCAMPTGGAWGQSGPAPAHVQAAQQKLQMVDISAEQRLAALRQSLLKTRSPDAAFAAKIAARVWPIRHRDATVD